ncbi:MAG: sulfatase-like hydrolase/transferase [Candidatus Glassbacteria bacterium]|nr:sulfatase-like hydrolase/transferase [Candidatus Glassbacteria bacterium]
MSCSIGSWSDHFKPNVLLIVLDAARADHFSCYGYHRQTTQNLDRLAGEGARFTMAVSTSSWTLPAHASLFTGLLPDEHNTTSRHEWLIERIPTLAELLVESGYRTAGFSNNPFVDRTHNLHRGFQQFEAVWADTSVTDSIHPYDTPHTNRLVKEFIARTDSSGRPFFAFINYMDTHMPYSPPEPYRSMYSGGRAIESARLDSLCRYSEMLNARELTPDSSEKAVVVDIYDGALTYLDAQLGELLDYLRDDGILDETLVIVLADHGEIYGERGHYTHGVLLTRPLVQIPLLMRYPELIPERSVRDETVSITDVFHTIARTAGVEGMTEEAKGRFLLGDKLQPAPAYSKLFWGREAVESRTGVDLRSIISAGQRHYILAEEIRWECYDLTQDFDEEKNLVPSRVSRAGVERAFRQFEQKTPVMAESRQDLVITEELSVAARQTRALKALGYVGGREVDFDDIHPHTHAHLSTAIRYYIREDYTKAEAELRSALTLESDNKEARRYLGFTLYRLGRFRESAGVLRALRGGSGDNYLVRLALGEVLEKTGQPDEALEQYLAASSMQPGDATAAVRAVSRLIGRNRMAEAWAIVEKMLALNPGELQPLGAVISVYLAAARWEEAKVLLLKAVLLERSRVHLNDLALCYLRLDQCEQARACLLELLEMEISPGERREYERQLAVLAC